MFHSANFDVAGPGLVVAAAGIGLLALCIVSLIVIILESLVLWRLHWGTFKRSLLAAFVMNLATSILGAGVVVVTLPGMAVMMLALWRLMHGIKALTGLDLDQVFRPPPEKKKG